jgi:hypothetical protein
MVGSRSSDCGQYRPVGGGLCTSAGLCEGALGPHILLPRQRPPDAGVSAGLSCRKLYSYDL